MTVKNEVGAEVNELRVVLARVLREEADAFPIDGARAFGLVFAFIDGCVSGAIQEKRGAVSLEEAGDLGWVGDVAFFAADEGVRAAARVEHLTQFVRQHPPAARDHHRPIRFQLLPRIQRPAYWVS